MYFLFKKEETMKPRSESIHPEHTAKPLRAREGAWSQVWAAHHWRRDCPCPGCRGPAGWCHGSGGSTPGTAALCPIQGLWGQGDACRWRPLWWLPRPSQACVKTSTWLVQLALHLSILPSLSLPPLRQKPQKPDLTRKLVGSPSVFFQSSNFNETFNG